MGASNLDVIPLTPENRSVLTRKQLITLILRRIGVLPYSI